MEIAKIIERNTTLKKFGLSFSSNGPRVLVDKYIMRNNDIGECLCGVKSVCGGGVIVHVCGGWGWGHCLWGWGHCTCVWGSLSVGVGSLS